MPDQLPEPGPKKAASGLRISDLGGLVVGYSLAAVLLRSFWGTVEPENVGQAVALCVAFVWLGLAMSGPIILLLDRRGPPPPPEHPTTHPPSRYSREETAWMVIGGYFIALTLFVVPARNRTPPWPTIFLIQTLVGATFLVWVPFARKLQIPPEANPPRWTRRGGLAMLIAWPLAWIALLLLVS